MSDLVGRFLGFEEPLGRALVKGGYYLGLLYLVISTLYAVVRHIWTGKWGNLLWEPLEFVVALIALRLGAELMLAVFSIEQHLRADRADNDGFEAGLTPARPPRPAPAADPAAMAATADAAKPTPEN